MIAARLLPARVTRLAARLTGQPALSRIEAPATRASTNYTSLACGAAAPRPLRALLCSPCGATHHVHTGALLLEETGGTPQPRPAAPRIAGAAPDHEAMMLRVTWATGGENRYPFIWMRDNCQCPACFHPTAKNRKLSMKALLLDVSPTAIQVSEDGQEVEVRWSDDHVSCFSSAWLQERTLNTHQQERLSENFSQTFSVRSKQSASNVAYTSGALDLHNDMVYLEQKPGIQVMHCLSQTKGKGGDHLLVDSFHVANKMRDNHPELFRVLADTVVSFIDVGTDSFGHYHAAARHSVIECDAAGTITGINISNHSRDAHFAMSPEHAVTWYQAYLTLRDLLNHPDNYITNKLQDGEMVAMDNYRVLHGRLAYEDSEGERHIVSGYWDWDEVRSKRRVLQASVSGS